MASKINPTSGYIVCAAGSLVGDSLTAPLASTAIPVSGGDFLDFTVDVATVGSLTDLRVQAVFTLEKDPAAWTTGTATDWAPVPSQALSAGVATMKPYEMTFAKADFFATAPDKLGATIPVRGGHVTLLFWDGAGAGTSSSVTIKVATREN